MELTEDRFWQMGYGSGTHSSFVQPVVSAFYLICWLMRIIYRKYSRRACCDWKGKLNPESGRKVMKYRAADRDQLAN